MNRILLLEDDANIALVAKSTLTSENFIVDIYKNATEFYLAIKLSEYDLLIFDWNLEGWETGVEVCQNYRARGGNKPILLLTARVGISDKVQALTAGADDYMVKPFDPNELIARVKALLRRPPNLALEVLRIGDLELEKSTFRVYKNGKAINILPKEFAILELLMTHPDRYFTAEAILNRIWEVNTIASEDSVRTFIKTLRKKLFGQKSDEVQNCYIENTRGLGYRLAVVKKEIVC